MSSETQPQFNRAAVSRSAVQTAARVSKTQRIPALDFTKGTLVLLMVLYHWLNYFTHSSWKQYRYLHFLTPSFIFISGFIISHVYLSKYDPSDPSLAKRLFTRGFKLMVIFVALNVARDFLIPILASGTMVPHLLDPKNMLGVFVTGEYTGKIVVFPILIPIAYLLMLSGTLMRFLGLYRYLFHVLCFLLLLSVSALGLLGVRSNNLELITIGILGVVIGFTPIVVINRFARRTYILVFGYLCYIIAITLWSVPYPLLIVGVCLSVSIIYLAGSKASESDPIAREVILLGKYSLFGYISQIAILQILSFGLRHVNLGTAMWSGSLFAAFILTVLSVEVVDRARARMASMDRLYKAVFA